MKSGKLNFLEPSGPLQACNGTALPFFSRNGRPGSVLDIATAYGLDGPGIESAPADGNRLCELPAASAVEGLSKGVPTGASRELFGADVMADIPIV